MHPPPTNPESTALDQTTQLTPTQLSLSITAIHIAEVAAHQAQSTFQSLQTALLGLHLPSHLWPPTLNRAYTQAFNHNRQAQIEFRRALRFLQTQQPSTPKSSANPKTTAAPKPPAIASKPVDESGHFQQTFYITVENGQTKTTHNGGAENEFWLTPVTWASPVSFTRNIIFPSQIVPPEYQWTLVHGPTIPPPDAILVNYTDTEFYRICHLEVESNSPHLIPGTPESIVYDNFRSRF